MVNDFEWAIETPKPTLYVGAKLVIDKNSPGSSAREGQRILFEVHSFGIGCISKPLADNIGKNVINLTIIENTIDFTYKVGDLIEVGIDRCNELVNDNYWQPYEEV